MALNFPNLPSIGDTYSYNDLIYQYNGTYWISVDYKTNNAYNTANTAFIHANAAFFQANNANIYAFGAHVTANGAQVHANAAFLQANNANIYAFGAHRTANSAQVHANAAFLQANNANIYAFGAHQTANGAQVHANAAFLQANNANIYAFGAHRTANSAQVHANAAFLQANQVGGAVSTANGALTTANTNMVFKTGNTMTGNLVMSGANIAFVTNSNAGIYWGGSGLSFIQSPNSNVIVFGTSSVERIRITSDGKIGIGVITPSSKLEVYDNIAGSPVNLDSQQLIVFGACTAVSGLTFSASDARLLTGTVSPSNEILWRASILGLYSDYYLTFKTNAAERMRIDSAGNVGIGTTSPVAALDIVGSVSDARANVLSQTLTDAGTINWDANLGRIATVTLSGNRIMNNATSLRVGTYILHVIQDGVGGRTLSFQRGYKFTANVIPTLTSAAGSRDMFSFTSDGTNLYGAFIPDVRS